MAIMWCGIPPYWIECDCCHDRGPSARTEEMAEEEARRNGWYVERGRKHICQGCLIAEGRAE